MKKIITAISFILMAAVTLPVQSFAIDTENPAVENKLPKEADARATQLLSRLDEIKAMDKESLSRTEKRELRKEVKEIRKEIKASQNGIYLSVGAIIIILLILILIL